MATFTVTNLFDSGTGSFRQAIFNANTQAGMDEIIFDTGGVPSTITLTSGALNIADSVNILGLGANLLTVSGNNNSRIFNIDDGGSDILDVLISGLTLTDGHSTNSGGAIFNADENLSLVDAVITGNTAEPDSGDYYGGDLKGGGIYNQSGNLKIVNSSISGNRAQGTIRLYNPSNSQGGGIFNVSGNLEISNSTISRNAASGGYLEDFHVDGGNGSGGGIFNVSGNVTITNSTININSASNATAASTDSNGGGIFNGSGRLTITNSTIAENGTSGGALGFLPGRGNGGGIFNDSGALSVNHSTISGNRAHGGTGDFYGNSGNGGGIYNRSGSVSVDYSTLSGNRAEGGAAFGRDGGTANGGGILNGSGDLIVTNSTISNNTAQGNDSFYEGGANSYGGGIFGKVTVINSTLSGNTAEGGNGGSLYNQNNPGNSYGGGIWGSGEVLNSTITGNTAIGGIGCCDYGSISNGIGFGSGIANADTMKITSSIVAGNANGDDIYGGFTSGGNNLIGINPLLSPLQNNGGSTETHALLPGSPAINAGSNPLGLLTDQRGSGFNRTVGSQTDIGAFEVQPSTSVPEPSSMFGLIGLVILGTGSLLRRKRQNKS